MSTEEKELRDEAKWAKEKGELERARLLLEAAEKKAQQPRSLA